MGVGGKTDTRFRVRDCRSYVSRANPLRAAHTNGPPMHVLKGGLVGVVSVSAKEAAN